MGSGYVREVRELALPQYIFIVWKVILMKWRLMEHVRWKCTVGMKWDKHMKICITLVQGLLVYIGSCWLIFSTVVLSCITSTLKLTIFFLKHVNFVLTCPNLSSRDVWHKELFLPNFLLVYYLAGWFKWCVDGMRKFHPSYFCSILTHLLALTFQLSFDQR